MYTHDNSYGIFADMILNEGLIKSDKDIYWNKEAFDNGAINICFITGLSGSGKSTMANSHQNVEVYELDDVCYPQHFSDENLKEYGDLIYSFFVKGPGKKYRVPYKCKDHHSWRAENGFNGNSNTVFYLPLINEFVAYAKSYAKSHKSSRFIIEGIQIYGYLNPEDLKDYAVYIKGTSASISFFRSLKRDISLSNGVKEKLHWGKQKFKHGFEQYIDGESRIYKWRKYYTELLKNKSTH